VTAADGAGPGERYRRLALQVRDLTVTEIRLSDGDPRGFWTWLAEAVRGPGAVSVVGGASVGGGGEPLHQFPPATGRVGVWIRGTTAWEIMETAYTVHAVGHLKPDVLRDLAYSSGHDLADIDRAAISASRGISVSYLGRSLDELAPSSRREFMAVWNEFHPEHRLRSVCSSLHREEVLERVLDAGIAFSDCVEGAEPCGDCLGCFELYYTAVAIGRDVGYKLTRRVSDEVCGHLQAYIASGFRLNHRDAMQRLVRLQMLYPLTFHPAADRA
jgi:hypothetical protein